MRPTVIAVFPYPTAREQSVQHQRETSGRTFVGDNSTSNEDLSSGLRLGVPTELREDGLGDLLLNPSSRVPLLLDHPRERSQLLWSELEVNEVRRLRRLVVGAVVREGEDGKFPLASEVELNSVCRGEAPLYSRVRHGEGPVRFRGEGVEGFVGEGCDVESDLELEEVTVLTSVYQDGGRTRFECLRVRVVSERSSELGNATHLFILSSLGSILDGDDSTGSRRVGLSHPLDTGRGRRAGLAVQFESLQDLDEHGPQNLEMRWDSPPRRCSASR
jgi:hypothetical protein